MNITNNSVPSVSIRWRQKEILGCVVYSHCPTNDSCSKCKHRCCLTCNYVTKPFGILKRVIKSEKVCVYQLGRAIVDTSSLIKVCGKILRPVLRFSGLLKR